MEIITTVREEAKCPHCQKMVTVIIEDEDDATELADETREYLENAGARLDKAEK